MPPLWFRVALFLLIAAFFMLALAPGPHKVILKRFDQDSWVCVPYEGSKLTREGPNLSCSPARSIREFILTNAPEYP